MLGGGLYLMGVGIFIEKDYYEIANQNQIKRLNNDFLAHAINYYYKPHQHNQRKVTRSGINCKNKSTS